MKADSEFDHRADTSIFRHANITRRRRINSRDDSQERALTGAIAADDSEKFTGLGRQVDIAQGPKLFQALLIASVKYSDKSRFDRIGAIVANRKRLGYIDDIDAPRHVLNHFGKPSFIAKMHLVADYERRRRQNYQDRDTRIFRHRLTENNVLVS